MQVQNNVDTPSAACGSFSVNIRAGLAAVSKPETSRDGTGAPRQSPAGEFAAPAHEVAHLCGSGIYVVALQSGWWSLRGIFCSDGHIIVVN